jgi:hypothetical protein
MDYNRQTNELRMLDMLVPRVSEYPRPWYIINLSPPNAHLGLQGSTLPEQDAGNATGVAPPNATASQRAVAERERDGFGAWEPKIGELSARPLFSCNCAVVTIRHW